MSAKLFWSLLWWQARGARTRFALLSASVAVGVAAVVAVLAVTGAVEAGIRVRSRELLGGDLAVESRRPLPDLTPSCLARSVAPRRCAPGRSQPWRAARQVALVWSSSRPSTRRAARIRWPARCGSTHPSRCRDC